MSSRETRTTTAATAGEEEELTLVEVRQQYGVPERTVYLWIVAGDLPTRKYTRDTRVYVRRADIERLIARPAPARGRPAPWRTNQGPIGPTS